MKTLQQSPKQRSFLRDNSLSLVILGLFAACWAAQVVTGIKTYNHERHANGQSPMTLRTYLHSGHFLEATAENWESEFLQMSAFVWLTAILHQRGSPESRSPDVQEPEQPVTDQSPWPARRGGWVARLYGMSLSLTFLLMFLISFALHALGGCWLYNEEQARLGQQTVSLPGFLATSEFWFQSFQNWQSEFLSIAAMVILAIFLRQRGSPESKDLATPTWEND